MSQPNQPGDSPHPNAITIDTDEPDIYEELDSDSEDGGMQLDPPDPTLQLQIASREMELEMAQDHERPIRRQEADTDFTTHPPNPFGRIPNGHNVPLSQEHLFSTDDDEDETVPDPDPFRLRMRTRMREEEHAALAILSDWELLVTYALTSRRTIPQTRRHFQAKLLSPHNAQYAEELYAARFAVPASKAGLVSGLHIGRSGPGAAEAAMGKSNEQAFLVSGAWKEVVSRNAEGWWAPGQVKGGSGKSRRSRPR